MFHGFTQDGADGVGVEQGGDPFGVALAEAMSGHRGVILPRVVAVAGEHVGAVEWGDQFDERLRVACRGFGERSGEFHGYVAVRAGELVVGHAEHVGEVVRRAVMPYGHLVVGYEGAHGGDEVAAAGDEFAQTVGCFLRSAVQCRGHDHLVFGQAFGRRVGRDEIAFHVEFEQRVVDVAHHVVVLEGAAEREAGLDEEPVERGQRFVADHDGHLVVLLQVDEPLPHFRFGDLAAEHARLAVGGIRFEVVAQQALPICFKGIVDGVPVPIFHHVGAGGEVGVGLQAQLARERHPAVLALGLRFEHQVVPAVLGGAGHVATEGDLLAGQVVLGGVVDVHAGDVHGGRGLEVVDGRLHAVGVSAPFEVEVVGDELVVMRVFAHDVGLPLQEGAHLVAAELVEFAAQGLVDGGGHVREVLPGVDAVGPVVEAEVVVELVQIAVELLPQVLDEQALHVLGDGIVVFRLVVHLVANDGRMVGDVGDELADHAFAVEAVGGVDDVHDLACAVFALAARGDREHARVEFDEPAGHRVGRRADDDVDAGAVGCVERAVHVGEVEYARLRFAGAPCGFGDADDVQSRSLHHRHVLIDAVNALHHEIFVVICGAEQNVVCLVTAHESSIVLVDFYI